MFFKKLFSHKPVFSNIFLLIYLFSFPPIILAGVLYYNNASTKLVNEYIKNDRNLVNQAVSAIELIMDTVVNASNQIYYDKEFIRLSRQFETLNDFEKDAIGVSLSRLKNASEYIHSVYMNFKASNMVFSSEYGYTAIDKFPDKAFVEASSSILNETHITSSRNLYESVFQLNPSKKMVTLINIPSTSYGFNQEQLFINISSSAVYDDIVKKLELEKANELMILNSTMDVIFYNTQSNLLTELVENNTIPEIITSGVSHKEIYHHDEKYLITSFYSPGYGWNYIWISPFSKISKVQDSIKNIIILYSVLLLVLIFFLGTLVIYRTARPIDELLKELSEKKETSPAGFNIFRLISNYMRTMITNNDRMKLQLEMAIPVFKNQFLVELLTKKTQDHENVQDRLHEFQIDFEENSFYVATLQILNLKELIQNRVKLNILKYSIEELSLIAFDNDIYNIIVVNIDEEKTSVIFNARIPDNEKSKSILYNGLKKLCDLIRSSVKVSLAVGVSENRKEISELSNLYDSSIKALQFRTLDTNNSIIFIDEVRSLQTLTWKDYSKDYEEKLFTYIATGNATEAVKALKAMLEEINLDKNMTKSFFDSQLLQITSMIMRIVSSANIDLNKELLRENNPLTELSQVSDIQDAEVMFVNILELLCERSKESRKDIEHFNIQRILSFIDEHIYEDLSMDTMSEQLNISSSHIYRILRNGFNKTFLEYLTERKIEKACELLQQGMKVKDVAKKLGYSSPNYFIYVFKRHKGSSPNQYKCLLTNP